MKPLETLEGKNERLTTFRRFSQFVLFNKCPKRRGRVTLFL